MIDLTPIFQAVLALLAALITYKLIPWIKARTTNEQQARIDAAEISARGSSFVAAALSSPVSVLLVVG